MGVEAAMEADAASEPARAVVRCGRPPRGHWPARSRSGSSTRPDRYFSIAASRARASRKSRRPRCAGKPTIYARYGSKEALFAAVVARKVRANTTVECVAAMGSTIEQRLEAMASVILERIVSPESIGLMRAVVAEARRFPELAISVKRQARDLGIESVARLLGEVARSGELSAFPAFAPERLPETARRFMDVIVFPMAMRALFGEDLNLLRAEIGPHVKQAVAFFLAACRHAPPAFTDVGQLATSEDAVL